MRWLLVRHGATIWSTGRAYAGWSDVPLSGAGRAAAVRLGRRLAGVPLTAAWTSDLGRAEQTLDLVLKERTLGDDREAGRPLARPLARPTVRVDPDLREMSFGAWEGRTYAEIAAGSAGASVLGGAGTAPGGESLSDLAARVARVFEDLCAGARVPIDGAPIDGAPIDGGAAGGGPRTEPTEPTTLIVSHGGPLRVLLCLALGLPPSEHWRFEVGHASLTEIAWDDLAGGRLVRLNDDSHLSADGRAGAGAREREKVSSGDHSE